MGLLTEDRKQLGLLLELTIRENASIADLSELSRLFVVDRKREKGVVDRFLGGLRLRAASWEQPVSSLSGGNQQKVLLARWLATRAKVLMFDEPPRASTSEPRPRSTKSSATLLPKDSPSSSCRPTCPRCSDWPTASS